MQCDVFYSKIIFMLDLKKEQWKHILPRGGKDFDVRLVAHTTVYYSKMDSLIVYGGIMAGLARLSKLSDRMFAFKISGRFWSEIHYPRGHLSDSYIPKERAFHTSVVIGNYLVVFGGYSHRHNKEEICYDNQMYLYHLECHTWVSHEVLGLNDQGNNGKLLPITFLFFQIIIRQMIIVLSSNRRRETRCFCPRCRYSKWKYPSHFWRVSRKCKC